MKKIKIICTIGPKTLNKDFLKFAKKNIDLLRLNMSHLNIEDLKKSINTIRKYTSTPICIDTEGAQIRTKILKEKFFYKNQKFKIFKNKNQFNLYPEYVFDKIRVNDILNIGFSNLTGRVIKKTDNKFILLKALTSGRLENNKGVHLQNRKIRLNFLTTKDYKAISVGKALNINNYALSFTNSYKDIIKFNKILKKQNKIYKIETTKAVNSFRKMLKYGKNFLIDRGDLSKEVKLENIPIIQRKLFKIKNKFEDKNLFVATNLLESMIDKNYPNRGEANDIFNLLELGSNGLVLAAETAIGKYPHDTVIFLKKMIKVFKKYKKK